MVTEQWDEYVDGEMETCDRCWGEGWISVCVDDLCHSDEGCIHGDGNVTCPDCKGHGSVFIPALATGADADGEKK